MNNDGIEIKGLDHFYNKLYKKAVKELPRETFKMLRKMGSKVRTQAARDSRKKVKKVTGNYHKGWKRGKAYRKSGTGDYEIRIGNNSKHAHLVEKGHRIVDTNGEEHGFNKGTPVLKDTVEQFQKKDMKDFVTEWLDNLVGEFRL